MFAARTFHVLVAINISAAVAATVTASASFTGTITIPAFRGVRTRKVLGFFCLGSEGIGRSGSGLKKSLYIKSRHCEGRVWLAGYDSN